MDGKEKYLPQNKTPTEKNIIFFSTSVGVLFLWENNFLVLNSYKKFKKCFLVNYMIANFCA